MGGRARCSGGQRPGRPACPRERKAMPAKPDDDHVGLFRLIMATLLAPVSRPLKSS